MDMERLKNSVNEANRKQESINKATTQQNDIQVFDFATKLFEELEEAKKKFIDSIKNISDETLQELIEREVIENQDNDDFLISFLIDTPMFDLFYTQEHDTDIERAEYEADEEHNETIDFTQWVNHHLDYNFTAWRLASFKLESHYKLFGLTAYGMTLCSIESDYSDTDMLLDYELAYGQFIEDNRKNQYTLLVNTINKILDKNSVFKNAAQIIPTVNELDTDPLALCDFKFIVDTTIDLNIVRDVLEERLTDFGLKILKTEIDDENSLIVNIKVQNPLK